MGTEQSSPAKANSNNSDALVVLEQLQETESRAVEEFGGVGMRGQKSNEEDVEDILSDGTEMTSDDEVTTDDEEEDFDSDEIEAGLLERAHILEDARALKAFATYHLRPELPVTGDGACARNFFSRPSAPEQEDVEAAEERAQILADLGELKQYAGFHLHPERAVETTGNGIEFGRSYFDRASAVQQETLEEAEERALILEDAAKLKKYASFHLHPERPVEKTSAACVRNYFSRPSAEEYDDFDDMLEREKVMEETAALKQLASWHLHPEKPVESTGDGTEFGRDYFGRSSAVEQETEEEMETREEILADVAELKKYASWHLHPEKPVESTSDGTEFGRNYFDRASAVGQESFEEAEERARVLEEVAELKKYASFHLHPEKPVESASDGTKFGRNYFDRASAVQQEALEEVEERALILEEAAELKKYATFHLHPERPVEKTSGACARNYFSRSSAPEGETDEEMEERNRVLEEVALLKKFASFHLHPEKPVVVGSNGVACGRNFFSRPSATINERIHTSGQAVVEQNDYDQHYNVEETNIRDSIVAALPTAKNVSMATDDENGKPLSRSPSDVLLFGYGEGEAY